MATALPQADVSKEHLQDNDTIRSRTTSRKGTTRRTKKTSKNNTNAPDEPPCFVIDLSRPPEQRYLEVCAALKDEMLGLTGLFDEVVGSALSFLPIRWLKALCWIFLRRVHNREENAELRGIAKATGIDMFLVVCLNVLLDLLMGCSSGGATVNAGNGTKGGTKMVHFRTLDWGMDSLRRVVVRLDFVAETNGPVIASSITYAGFVGVLTGVRKDLSMSLNFRPHRIDNGKFWADLKYNIHLVMVLLGLRPSIPSHLRHFLLPQDCQGKPGTLPSYAQVVAQMGGTTPIKTTACYLCFCDGQETTVIEKDRICAVVRTDKDFIVVTNCDRMHPSQGTSEKLKGTSDHAEVLSAMIDEAEDRLQCAQHNWLNTRAVKAKDADMNGGHDATIDLHIDDVVQLVQKFPTMNECTHFACVMDPTVGSVVWCRRWWKPVGKKWIRAHMSEAW